MDIRTASQQIRNEMLFGLRIGYMNAQRPDRKNWWVYQGWLEGKQKAGLNIAYIVDFSRRVYHFNITESDFVL